MPLFQKSVLKKHILDLNTAEMDSAFQRYAAYFHNATIQQNIRNAKEEQFQEGFLRELFGTVLNYTLNPNPNFNLTTELKNTTNSKKADGTILVDEKAVAVIELKGTETTDLNKIETQAFGYKNNQAECNYVITSNFEKLRFYIDNTIDFEEFNLFTLKRDQFSLLYLCLSYENIKNNIPKRLKAESVSQEDQITKKLYKDYSEFKRALYNNLVELNPQFDKLLIFKKTQKLLDRFLFIFFAEDTNLLPTNLIFRINKEWKNLQEMRIPVSLYDRYLVYFNDLNHGAKVTLPAFGKKTGEAITAEFEIFAYNGGLFHPDEILDHVKIDDTLLHTYSERLSHYDFDSDVDVNILGHIFENSLNEIDEIKSEIEGTVVDKTKTKRKKDGVFYTPKYITKYIVDNTVGKLCVEKKAALKLIDEDYISDKKLQTKTKKALLDKLGDYRSWLLQLTICDPACGSGAFLNQALEFLIAEHRYVDELQAKLMGDALILSDIETSILENNIYGVDLNDESVEIAKLSLWLRTAQKGRKLNSLNKNIKCGNSLIDDPEVAGEKAFYWEKEFPEVFAKGGFDVVIGNPPYVRPHNINDEEKVFLWGKYFVASQKTDLYAFFTEKGALILRKMGIIGYIMPKTWMSIHSFFKLREFILKNYQINQIGVLPSKVFDDAIVETAIIIFENNEPTESFDFIDVIKNSVINTENQFVISKTNNLNINENVKKDLLNFKYLGDITEIIVGIATGDDKKYCRFEKLTELDKKAIRGANISRYCINYTGEYLWYDREQIIFDGNNKPKSSLKQAVGQSSPKKPSDFEIPEKIVMQRISKKIIAALDTNQYYAHTSVVLIKPLEDKLFKTKFILAILNSSYINFWLKTNSSNVSINVGTVKNIPIKIESIENQNIYEEQVDAILSLNKDFQTQTQKLSNYISSQYQFEKLSVKLTNWYELDFLDFIKELNKAIKAAKGTPLTKKDEFEWMELFEENKKKALELKAEIDRTDKEIDVMVYALYGLTEEEIMIVEGV